MPKDGPSAGVTMATAIASLVRGEPVADDVGMTGEITLTGQVLPIGGMREKSLAAQRAGLKRVIFPRENEPDLDELPPETRDGARVHPGRHDRGRLRGRVRRQAPARARARAAQRRSSGSGALSRAAKLVSSCRADASSDDARRRQSSWYSRLPAQDEGVLVDVVADRRRRSECDLHAAGRDRAAAGDRAARSAARSSVMRSVELVRDARRRARPCTA